MANRVLEASNALDTLLRAALTGATHVRNPSGQSHFAAGEFVASLMDDQEPEVLQVLTGPVYELKLVPVLTLVRKAGEAARRDGPWADVDTIRAALAVDPTLGGVVEDARIAGIEGAEMDRARWMGGGLDLSIRLLFAAPSPAG